MIDPFCTSDCNCINIGFSKGSFVWKCCVFNYSAFNNKTVFQCFQKVVCFFFKETFFKVKVLETSNIFSDCHIKMYRPPKQRRTILKIPSIFLFAGFKMKLLRTFVFMCYDKKLTHFAVKFFLSNRPFFVYLMNHLV